MARSTTRVTRSATARRGSLCRSAWAGVRDRYVRRHSPNSASASNAPIAEYPMSQLMYQGV